MGSSSSFAQKPERKQSSSSFAQKPERNQSSSSVSKNPERKPSSSSVSKTPDPFPIEKRKLPNGEVEYAPKGNETEAQKPVANKAEAKPEAKTNGNGIDKSFTKSKPSFNID